MIFSLISALKSRFYPRDPGEARTLDPLIKSQLLYQLSYGVKIFRQNYYFCNSTQADLQKNFTKRDFFFIQKEKIQFEFVKSK